MKFRILATFLLLIFSASCLRNYRDPKTVIPSAEKDQIKYKTNFDAGELKNPGKLQQSDFGLIQINGRYLYQNPDKEHNRALCVLTVFTLTVIPCSNKSAEKVELEISAPSVSKKRYEITNEVDHVTYTWLPFLFLEPFFSDKSPDRPLAISMHEKYDEVIKKIDELNKHIAELKVKIKKLKANPRQNPVLMTDFTSFGYILEGGGDVRVKIYNNSNKVIQKAVYTIYPGNFMGKTGDEKVLTNTERIEPGNFSKKTYFRNANPRKMMGDIYMESITVTYEDGSTYTMKGPQVRNISVMAPEHVIREP